MRPAARFLAVTALAIFVTGCGGDPVHDSSIEEDDALQPEAQRLPEPDAIDLRSVDFASLELGARLAGSERSYELRGPGGAGAIMRSYVACPANTEPCEADELGEGEAFTYVLQVEPTAGTSVLRTASAVDIHNNIAGFDVSSAEAALSDAGARLAVTCEEGALVWGVIGGRGWDAGETLTLFWQSRQPPVEREGAYELVAAGELATGPGLVPAGDAPRRCG